MTRWVAPLAVATAALYIVLAIGASTCLLAPPAQPGPLHHHGKSHVAHSAFCAWACQVNPAVSLHSAAPQPAILELVTLLLVFGTALQAKHLPVFPASRAPPR